MIASVQGVLESIGDGHVVLRVAGIGLLVYVPTPVAETLGVAGDRISLYTTFLIRDDVPTLYGFPVPEGKRLFDLLMGVSGIGPRLALELLAVMTPDDAAVAIVSGNTDLLSSVPGIGKRTAGRIVVDLQAKLQREWESAAVGVGDAQGEVAVALQALGYSAAEVQQAVSSLGDVGDTSLEERVRLALQSLARE
jgi:Holliday junction DNA helicase RuvA